MHLRSAALPIERATAAVWASMLVLGITAWSLSSTPLAGACVVLAVLLATTSPVGALYATCAAIPLVFHPIEIGSLQLGMLELGILVTVAGSIIRAVFDFVEGRRIPRLQSAVPVPVAVWVLPILLLLIGTLSLVWIPFELHRAEALRTWRWVILEPLLMFVVARMAIGREGAVPLTIAIVLPAGVVAVAAIWQMESSNSTFSVDNVHRSTATYLHPNNLALYLERAAMLSLVPGVLLRSRVRWFFLVLSALLLAGIASTFSRGVLLGLAVGIATVLLAHPIRHGWRVLGASILSAIAAFALLAGSRLTGADSSGFLSTRKYLWAGSVEMLRDFPFGGIGLDQFLWLNQTRYIDPRIWNERYTSHPHNLLLDSWLSLGIAGLALLAAFVLSGGWVVWRARTGRLRLVPWQLGALGCLAAGLGHGMVDNGYFLADLSALTWLAIALLIGTTPAKVQLEHE